MAKKIAKEYFLMHKDIPVALMEISEDGILGNYRINNAEKDHIPLGGQMNEMKFHDWWKDNAFQIYCDFSGYSDIAIGSAKLMGIDLMTNFRSPYFSRSIREFWSRWHISLSTWFRDYVYIPLGGSRCSPWKSDRNLLITFLVSGLWHGANWTFVVWGCLHGLAQAAEKRLGWAKPSKGLHPLRCAGVFAFCCFAWVFFRAEQFSDAFLIFRSLFSGFTGQGTWTFAVMDVTMFTLIRIGLAVGLLCIYDLFALKTDVIVWVSQRSRVVRWSFYILLVWLILALMSTAGQTDFVYFQF